MPQPKMNASVHAQKDVAANYNQIRLRVRAMVGPARGVIEQAADQTTAGTTNSDQLFRQGRWEAELFESELMAELPVAQALTLAERAVTSAEQAAATVDRLAPATERAVGVAENVPKLIAAERKAAIEDLQVTAVAERKALTSDLEQISLNVVDHAFLRAAQRIAAVLVLLAIGLAAVFIFPQLSLTKGL